MGTVLAEPGTPGAAEIPFELHVAFPLHREGVAKGGDAHLG